MKHVQFAATGKPHEVKAQLAAACRTHYLPGALALEAERLKGEIVPGGDEHPIVVFSNPEDAEVFVCTCRFLGYIVLAHHKCLVCLWCNKRWWIQ